ncbi:MAG TPA: xanthine dehydrogenase family protein subunit M [Ktedonobacterales bacterium]|nr:xanthine dehydrogenase family protein subunit M [Ktedonobacterales bacterium]
MLKIRAYHRPKQIDEAINLLSEPDVGRTVIAGGTDLLVNPRYMVGVREVVDLRDLGLTFISGPKDDDAGEGMIVIGATTTMRQVALSPLIQGLASGILARSAAVCASPNIRNMATLGGNTASALPSADTPPTLMALDALLVLAGPHGRRTVPLGEYFTGPARSIRQPGEIITEFRIPQLPANMRGGFYKIGRLSDDIAMVNAAVTLVVRDGLIAQARVILGAVAPTPLRVRAAEAALEGQPLTEAVFQQAADLAVEAARPISDQRASADYRRRMSGVATLRALRQAAGLVPQPEEWHHA